MFLLYLSRYYAIITLCYYNLKIKEGKVMNRTKLYNIFLTITLICLIISTLLAFFIIKDFIFKVFFFSFLTSSKADYTTVHVFFFLICQSLKNLFPFSYLILMTMWAFSEGFSSHFSLSLHILPKTDIFAVISASIQGPPDSWNTSSMNTEGQWWAVFLPLVF